MVNCGVSQPGLVWKVAMCQNLTIRVQKLARVSVDLVSLALTDYGSLALDTLAVFESELMRIAHESGPHVILLDLGHRKRLGAGFLQCIAKLRDALMADDRMLIVCGDDGGLLRAIGWGHFIRHYPDIVDALNASAAEVRETDSSAKMKLIAPSRVAFPAAATVPVHGLRQVLAGDTLEQTCQMPKGWPKPATKS